MPPTVRDLVGDIRDSLERFPREALVEILTYVFKEYVVEGAAPLSTNAAPLRDELEGQSFGELIRGLQLRLDLPELGLFEVQGDRVLVRIAGRQMAIETSASRAEPMAPQVAPAPMNVPPPPPIQAAAPSLSAVAVAVAVAAQARSLGQAMPPGVVRDEFPLQGGRTQPATPAPVSRGPASPAARTSPPPPSSTAASPAKPAEEGIEKPARFGLLEID